MSTHGPHSLHKTNAEAEARESASVLGVSTLANCTVGCRSPQDSAANPLTFWGPNLNRLEPAGVRNHEARTNLCLRSEQLGVAFQPPWLASKSWVYDDAAAAPDGVLDADAVLENADPGVAHALGQVVTVANSTQYCLSFFLKAWTRYGAQIRHLLPGGNAQAKYDLNAITATLVGGIGTSVGIEDWGNGWRRCWIVYTTGVADVGARTFYLYLSNDDGTTVSYDGDGMSGLIAWGAQFEAGHHPSPYIETGAASASSIAPAIDFDDPWHLYNLSRDAIQLDVRIKLPFVPADGTEYPIFCAYEDGTHFLELRWCPAGGGDTWKVNQNIGGGVVAKTAASVWAPNVTDWFDLRFRARPAAGEMTLEVIDLTTDTVVESVTFDHTFVQLDAAHLYCGYHPASGEQWDCWYGEPIS